MRCNALRLLHPTKIHFDTGRVCRAQRNTPGVALRGSHSANRRLNIAKTSQHQLANHRALFQQRMGPAQVGGINNPQMLTGGAF